MNIERLLNKFKYLLYTNVMKIKCDLLMIKLITYKEFQNIYFYGVLQTQDLRFFWFLVTVYVITHDYQAM